MTPDELENMAACALEESGIRLPTEPACRRCAEALFAAGSILEDCGEEPAQSLAVGLQLVQTALACLGSSAAEEPSNAR